MIYNSDTGFHEKQSYKMLFQPLNNFDKGMSNMNYYIHLKHKYYCLNDLDELLLHWNVCKIACRAGRWYILVDRLENTTAPGRRASDFVSPVELFIPVDVSVWFPPFFFSSLSLFTFVCTQVRFSPKTEKGNC